MNPWTALLESLHSALIDELTERHPEPKPELGMPQRHKAIAMPAPGVDALICEVTFALAGSGPGAKAAAAATATGEARGFALFALDPDCAKKLKLDTRKMWDALLKRAGREFNMRGISPRVSAPIELKNAELPKGFAVPARVIWIPFKLAGASCYLGVGA